MIRAAIKAVAYRRRSTLKQEVSLEDQQKHIQRYAAEKGYELVGDYVDSGITGDSIDERPDFRRMLDAADGKRFQAIIVWDQDRFCRLDSIDAGVVVAPLRKAGVQLVVVNSGAIDWNDFGGRLLFTVTQEGKHQYLRDLSKNTARGMISASLKGHLSGRQAPYGYDRMLVDERGEHRQRIRRGEKYSKPRAWHVTLVPGDEAEHVRWMLEVYDTSDIGARGIAHELNRRGVLSATGGQWYPSAVHNVLTNEAYVGRFIFGRRRIGKYNRVQGDKIVPRTDGTKAVVNPREEWTVIDNVWEPLVDEQLFKRVQKRLAKTRQCHRTHKSKNDYVLTGLLYCECGHKMHGTKFSRKKGGAVYVYPKYLCSKYSKLGAQGCNHNAIAEQDILDVLLLKVRETVFAGGLRDELERRVEALLEARQQSRPEDAARLRKQIGKLDAEIAQGTKRLLTVPDNIYQRLAESLSDKQRERDALAEELDELLAVASGRVSTPAKAIVDQMWTTHERLKAAQPGELRELLAGLVERVDLRFEPSSSGRRTHFTFAEGRISLRKPSFGFVRRGEPLLTLVNEIAAVRLVLALFPQVREFNGDAVLALVEPGLYSKRR